MKEDTKNTKRKFYRLVISLVTAILLIVAVVLRFVVKEKHLEELGIDNISSNNILILLALISVVAGWYAKDSWRKVKDKWVEWYKSYKMKRVPEITWGNDGFAYMTVESRFKDNFNKSGLCFDIENVKPKPKDQYSYFADKQVLDENMLKSIFPKENETSKNAISPREDYCRNYKAYMSEMLAPYKGKKQSYLFSKAPFIFAEHYYFYSILYYMREDTKDPWKKAKDNLHKSIEERIKEIVKCDDIGDILKSCVNSNTTDLSQNQQNIGSFVDNALVKDDTEKFRTFIDKGGLSNKDIHIIVDNCGIELISDIMLGLYLLEKNKISTLYFHFNVLPIFVSDVVKSDIEDALKLIKGDGSDESRKELVEKYKKYRADRCIVESADVFWNMPIPFKNAPDKILHDKFNATSTGLVIFKGDLNYRRLVGDRKWRIDSPLEEHIKYITPPILILRSLKSNVLLGIDKETATPDEACPSWKTTGDFGIIQFIEKP